MSEHIPGIGFGGLLTIVLITLKLCKVIAWSWWLVLLPVWAPLAAALGIFGVFLVVYAVGGE
jgi:hypothetical protein